MDQFQRTEHFGRIGRNFAAELSTHLHHGRAVPAGWRRTKMDGDSSGAETCPVPHETIPPTMEIRN